MNTQPEERSSVEALRLAEYWAKRANDLQTWVDENDYVEFGYRPEGLKREQADQRRTAAELRRLHALNAQLTQVSEELLESLKEINSMVYDQWTNGAMAQRIANAAIAHAEGTYKAEGEQNE